MASSDEELTTAIFGFSRSASLRPSARHWALLTAVLAPRLRSWTMGTPDYSAAAAWAAPIGDRDLLRSPRTTRPMPTAQAARIIGQTATRANRGMGTTPAPGSWPATRGRKTAPCWAMDVPRPPPLARITLG